MCAGCGEWEHKLADTGRRQQEMSDDTDTTVPLTRFDTVQQQIC